jgi:hypothetical protein
VNKPRLRRKGRGVGKEVSVPVYEALQKETATGERMLQILLNGVSTRRYRRVIPEMADTVGVSNNTWSNRGSIPPAGGCLSSMAPKLCARPSMRCLAPRLRCNGVEITSYAMGSDDFLASSRLKPRR